MGDCWAVCTLVCSRDLRWDVLLGVVIVLTIFFFFDKVCFIFLVVYCIFMHIWYFVHADVCADLNMADSQNKEREIENREQEEHKKRKMERSHP
jgi:energy-converting hydrogenase Eha subunit H